MPVPTCGNLDLKPGGFGTQRSKTRWRAAFPLRASCGLTATAHATRTAGPPCKSVRAKVEADILVGTQLLAKGHDFPNLTLVGVINADSALYSPDFRASEHLFAQLMQVGGRAGRAERGGRSVDPDAVPGSSSVSTAATPRLCGICCQSVERARRSGFPPFVHQAVLRAEAPQIDTALAFLQRANAAAPDADQVTLFDPTPAAMPRKAGLERGLLLMQSPSTQAAAEFLSASGCRSLYGTQSR